MSLRVLFVVKELEGAEPLGALYVAGCLEAEGHACRFVGTRGNDVLAEVARFEPDVVAFGPTTGLHGYYLGLAYAIKTRFPRVITYMGGPHATYFPEVLQSPGLDVVCRGEGEDASVELQRARVEPRSRRGHRGARPVGQARGADLRERAARAAA